MNDLDLLRARMPDAGEWEDRGDGLFRATGDPWHNRYVLIAPERNTMVDGQIVTQSRAYATTVTSKSAPNVPEVDAEVRRLLEQEIAHQRLPTCVVPDCREKAPYLFKAAERGRLAGRDWVPGAEIRTCPEHGHDIYVAQGARGRDQLAEWLRPDAKLDPQPD